MTTAIGFADVSHLVDRQGGLQGEVLLRPRRHAQGDFKLGDVRDVGRREDRDHAVALPRRLDAHLPEYPCAIGLRTTRAWSCPGRFRSAT
jgi:hypothetical protein